MAGKVDEAEGIGTGRRPRPPSLLDALLPIVVLIVLIALTIAFFGGDATNGRSRSRCSSAQRSRA